MYNLSSCHSPCKAKEGKERGRAGGVQYIGKFPANSPLLLRTVNTGFMSIKIIQVGILRWWKGVGDRVRRGY